ncbi:MAG: hypothetical protein SGILL_009029, partial [Bacillariaceae sp.]
RPRGSGKLAAKKKARTVISLQNVEVVAGPEGTANHHAEFPAQQLRAPESQENANTPPQLGDQTQNGDSTSTSAVPAQANEPQDHLSSSSNAAQQPEHSLNEQEETYQLASEPTTGSLDRGVVLNEEKQIMQRLDTMISKKEERVVMQHLMKNIQETEDVEGVKARPSLVREVTEQGVWEQQHENNPWQLQRRRRKQRKGMPPPLASNGNNALALVETPSAIGNSLSNVMEVGEIEVQRVRQPLPKWEPSSPRQKLFTRPEYVEHVISKINQELPPEILYCPQLWQVRILEEDGNDSNSYVLEAHGQHQYLELLRDATERFVQNRITFYNRQELVADEESFIVDAIVSIRAGPLGMTLIGDPDRESEKGVWVQKFKPDSRIGQLLGGKDAYGGGCALLSINDTDVTDAPTAHQVIVRAKDEELRSPFEQSKITLCLSKTANFRNSSDSAALSIRRIYEDLYDAETCEHVVLNKYLRENPPPPPMVVERARIDEENALTSNVPDGPPQTKKACKYYFQSVMEDDRSVEVELVLNTSEGGFGAKIHEVPDQGLFFRSISPKKQLGKALGRIACLFGAVLWKFEGQEVHTREDLNQIIKNMGNTSYSVTLGKSGGCHVSS